MKDELIDFSKNRNSFEDIKDIETVCLCGNPNAVKDAELTIMIPTYKRAGLLKRAIDSALNQNTTIVYKVYVVDNEDDFSETDTFRLIKQYSDIRLSYFKNKSNIGMAGNLNRCGELADTKYFSLLHDDDALLPNYIENIKFVLMSRKYDIVHIGFEQRDSPFSNTEDEHKKKSFAKKFIKKSKIFLYKKVRKTVLSDNLFFGDIYGPPTCGVLFKTSTFLLSGGFDNNFYPSFDWYYFIFTSQNYNCIKLNKLCGIYYWGVNASLKENALCGFKRQKEQIIKSLIGFNSSCKIYYKLFMEQFDENINSRLKILSEINLHIYNFIKRLKSLKYIVF